MSSPQPLHNDDTAYQQSTIADDPDDPVVASYSVFIKPPLAENRKLVVFQYVNKTSQDPAHIRPPRITEIRVKPKTGMYEVDVPVDTSQAYDQSKGIRWGTALQKSMETKKGGSLGLAGGFGIGGAGPRAAAAGGRRGGEDVNAPLTWQEATRQDKVIRTQTLGGGRSAEEETARYMVGVFQGKNIHLTPVSSLVHLRPVPHHLDAATEQERLSRPTPGGAAAAAAAEKAAGRAIHMTLKAAMDDDGVATETMADRLRAVQAESWRRMEWFHDEAEAAWEAYNDCLLLRSDGKDKEPAAEAAEDDSGSSGLVEKVTQLRTDWQEDELLRAVSGIKPGDPKPGEEAVSHVRLATGDLKGKGKAKIPAGSAAQHGTAENSSGRLEQASKNTGAAAADASGSRRGRARGAGRAESMQLD